MSDTATKKKKKSNSKLSDSFSLILWNDDVNSIDDIIDALVDICEHDVFQAEQCATIAHYKGKCSVKSGEEFKALDGMKKLFDHRLINTSIE